jgi:hypothetical protein
VTRDVAGKRVSLADLVGIGVVLACIAGLSVVRAGAADRFSKLRVESDVYALPPPEHTAVMSLGFRSAVADFIWAHVLVSYGVHFQEKRRFEHVGDYLETVMYLDPTFPQPYLYADTLLTIQPKQSTEVHYDRARELLLKGTEALPYNQQVWFVAGQFIAYVAPPHLKDPDKKERWRLEGAKLLARACELATDNQRLPHHCIVAASLLNKAGRLEAMIEMLTRTMAVNDDPEIQKLAQAQLAQLGDRQLAEERARRQAAWWELWRDDLSYVRKDQFLILGPELDVFRCAGSALHTHEGCDTSWLRWSERFSRSTGSTRL